MTAKSAPILFGVMFVLFLWYFTYREKISFRMLILVGIVILFLGTYQIKTYLMNENSPRYLFFYYGGVTANRFFPFGSGFATFGSDQAAKVYSELYYNYGFHLLHGMTTNQTSFLCDTFWAMAIGQFGWIGSALYFSVYFRIFLSFRKRTDLKADQKAFLYAGYIQYMIHAVGSAILSSASGMIGFIALAMLLGSNNEP